MAGRIGKSTYSIGDLVGPESGTLATIVSQDPIYVTFQVSEREVIAYKQRVAASPDKAPHQTIHIKLANGTMYPVAGTTNFLDVQVDPNTDTETVRAKLPNPDGILVPGAVVGVIVERGAPRATLLVPLAAVQFDQAGHYVLLVDAANKVELRRITTGAEQGREVVVLDGLKEGEMVIVEGIQKVRPGQVVKASVAPGN